MGWKKKKFNLNIKPLNMKKINKKKVNPETGVFFNTMVTYPGSKHHPLGGIKPVDAKPKARGLFNNINSYPDNKHRPSENVTPKGAKKNNNFEAKSKVHGPFNSV